MKIEQKLWTHKKNRRQMSPETAGKDANLVLAFGSTSRMKETGTYGEIRDMYPNACILGCSTAGEILDTSVEDDSIALTAIHFEHSTVSCSKIGISDFKNSREAGKQLVENMELKGLRHLFILSDGLKVNGSELIKGVLEKLPPEIQVTGGLSGDGGRFQETYVMAGAPAETGAIAALGLYGERLRVGYGSLGGWDPFGPERLITRSKANVLYEMDGQSALELYKKYLGKHAEGLPATGLLFPLSVRIKEDEQPLVRTILAVDGAQQSMTFAGDVPEGAYAKLMKANIDRLIDGAVGAAEISRDATPGKNPQLALLISCVGRKMVLKQRVEEEVEGVKDVLGPDTMLTGFYSYGEISPFAPGVKCELHNQTMTITTLSED